MSPTLSSKYSFCRKYDKSTSHATFIVFILHHIDVKFCEEENKTKKNWSLPTNFSTFCPITVYQTLMKFKKFIKSQNCSKSILKSFRTLFLSVFIIIKPYRCLFLTKNLIFLMLDMLLKL